MEPAYKLLTVEEFLVGCPNDQRHYQLFDGIVVAMAPPGGRHQAIAGNLTVEIGLAVRKNLPGCTIRPQAGIAPQGLVGRNHFETDLAVTCEPGLAASGIAEHPLLIVEVLSPGTVRDDFFIKLPAYQEIPSLREILYVETEKLGATVYRRGDAGWETVALDGPAARLRLLSIGLDIPLAELYRGVPGI